MESPEKIFLRLCDAAGTSELRETRDVSQSQIIKAKEALFRIDSTIQVLEFYLAVIFE